MTIEIEPLAYFIGVYASLAWIAGGIVVQEKFRDYYFW